MDIIKIADKADRLVRKYKTRDPFLLADYLHITLIYRKFEKLKGCFLVNQRNAYIILNDSMEDHKKAWVLGHEIGHRILHYADAVNLSKGIMTFSLYDKTTKPEREANLFAAELLVDDDVMTEYIYNNEFTAEQCDKAMCLHPSIISLKTEIMDKRGINVIRQEYDRNFLK